MHYTQGPLKPLESANGLLSLLTEYSWTWPCALPRLLCRCITSHAKNWLHWRELNQVLGLLPESLLRELHYVKCIRTGGCERPTGRKFTLTWTSLQKGASQFSHLAKSPFSHNTWQARNAHSGRPACQPHCSSLHALTVSLSKGA